MQIKLNEVETIYQKEFQNLMEHEEPITARSVIELSESLFKSVKVKDISDSDDEDADMLLYQYGVYYQGEILGKCFVFNITRQFIDPEEDEPYQLSFDLYYDSEPFINFESCTTWSYEFSDIHDFFLYIKSTEGFTSTYGLTPKKVQVEFCQC